MKKNTFYNVLNNPIAKVALATSLLISTGVSVTTPILTGGIQQAEAAETKTYTSTESTNQTQTQTFTVPDITKLNSVIADTGKVEIVSVVGNQITLRMTDGKKIRTDQTGGTFIPVDTQYVSGQTSNYYNNGGYTGALTQYVESGAYTPADTRVHTVEQSRWEASYEKWNGSFWEYDAVTSAAYTGKAPAPYNVDGYYGEYVFTRYLTYEAFSSMPKPSNPQIGSSYGVAPNGNGIALYTATAVRPASDTRVYKYEGNVTKPASDTRTYADIYQYNLTFDYETDSIPPDISLTPSLTTPTNKNVDVQVNATDLGGLKQVKWAKGNQTDTYFSTQGNAVLNNTFTVSENDTYTVYAEDLSGNKTIETILIDNIDKSAPSLAIITASITDITNLDVGVSIAFPTDAEKMEYRLDNGSWIPYTTTIEMSSNGKIEARSVDLAGNTSETAFYIVENIDKVNPTIQTVSIVDNYLTVITNDSESAVMKIEVKMNNDSYNVYQEKKFKVNQNTEVSVRVTDKAGNVTEKSFSLMSDKYYQDLLDQLVAIQTQINAGGQNKSELNNLLVSIENINQEATNLVLPTEQTSIQTKASALSVKIKEIKESLEKAKVELEDLGNKPTQLELDKAKEIIEALPPGPEKETLLKELEEKQNQKDLQDVQELVDNLSENPTQSEIEQLRDAINNLIDSPAKTELLNAIEGKQLQLDGVTNEAIKVAEDLHDRSTLEDIQHAKDLINKLPEGPEKTALLDKVKAKEKAIKDRLTSDTLLEKGKTSLKHAETFPTNFNIELAEKAINILPDGPEKASLLADIEAIKDNLRFEEAEKKVVQVERYERDPYLADAIKLVDSLKESDGKKALKDRLQTILDKAKAIKDAEEAASGNDGIFDPTNPDRSIVDAINTIQDPVAKSYLLKWHKANDSASKYFSRAMTTNASKVMNDLPESYLAKVSYANLIAELTTRTENLAKAWEEASRNKATEQLFSKTYTLVDLYESSKSDRNYKNAIAAVAALPDGVAKTAIETQLASLKNHIEEDNDSTPSLNSKESIESSEKAVTNYEKYKSSYYLKKATEAVEALTDSEEKIAFQARIETATK